jgi:hypothetical protein
VFIYHPVASFILPLAVACLLCPPLRRLFPELAWFTGETRCARIVQVYLVFSFAPTMAMNSGGLVNLALNLAFAIILLLALLRLARPVLSGSDGRQIVVFGRRGFAALCGYLALLYGVGYVALRPGARPSVGVQLFTFVFYALAIAGLWMHRRREPLLPGAVASVEKRELRLLRVLFAVVLALGLALSPFRQNALLYPPLVLNFVTWSLLGFLLTALALKKGVREFCGSAELPPGITKVEDPVQ